MKVYGAMVLFCHDLSIPGMRENCGRADFERVRGASLESIQKRLGGEKFAELRADLLSGDNALFIRKLLVEYYDKAYLHAREDASFYHEVI